MSVKHAAPYSSTSASSAVTSSTRPPRPEEIQHGLRIACGNGLRPEVWEPFQSRFRIPRILEYYASTEGNFSLYNCEGHPGAIGRIPAVSRLRAFAGRVIALRHGARRAFARRRRLVRGL
jgi:hypothetical protein